MADILLNTAELLTVLPPRDRPEAFLRDRYFPTTVLSDAEEVAFDTILPDRELAPLVHPDVPGKDSANRGFKVTSFAPAYVKPQNTLRPKGNMIRMPGERIGGESTPAQRYAYNLATIIDDHPDDACALISRGKPTDYGTLRRQVAALRTGLIGLGLEPGGPYRPHLTLARARFQPVDLRHWLADASPSVPDGRLEVGRVELMRSHLGAGPARYETLATVTLR